MRKPSEYLNIEAAPKGYRIVQWGDITKAKEKRMGYRRFTCSDCGCIFEADKEHYTMYSDQREGTNWYETICPCCNAKMSE